MNKELSPLGDLMTIITACACLDIGFISSNECVKKFENVKNALKRLESIDEVGLITGTSTTEEAEKEIEEYLDTKKKLKAFEIMSQTFVMIGGANGNFEGEHPENEVLIHLKDITAEEFDLIEETLIGE